MELNKVYNMDCLIGMQDIPDKSIDMILCDLPYGTTQNKWDVVIPFDPLWKQYERIIKGNGAIVLTSTQPFASDLVISKKELFRYDIVWDKINTVGHLNCNRMPMRRHELILVFYKGLPTYNPQKKYTGTKYHSKGKTKENVGGSNYGFAKPIDNRDINAGFKYPDSILSFTKDANSIVLHPTQKPVALFEYLIKTYTNEGETVLDNCMGSGTAAIACINTDRNYIGFEKEEKYFNIIQERIKNHTPQLKLAV